MALRVWLPLNGNLNNLGLSPAVAEPVTTASFSEGKIGQCLSGGKIKIPANYVGDIFNNEHMSICFWYYTNTDATTGNHSICGFSGNGEGDSGAVRSWDFFAYSVPTTLHWSMGTIGGGSLANVLPNNQWTHIAVTFDGSKLLIYLNGILKYTGNGSSDFTFDKSYYISFGSALQKLNDFRIYDECLSPKQIKEISKGLVVHYKLDNQFRSNRNITLGYYGTTTNSGWGAHRGTAVYTNDEDGSNLPFNKIIKFTVTYDTSLGTGGGTSVYPTIQYDVDGNTTYTYSTYIKAEDNLSYINGNFLYRYEYNSSGTKLTEAGVCSSSRKQEIGNGWFRIWGTFTTQADTAKVSLPFYTYCGKNNIYYLGGQQLELGDTMTPYIDSTYNLLENELDYSGNGYYGTISGTLNYSPDSAKYSGCTYFDGTNSISHSNGLTQGEAQEWTCMAWVKPTVNAGNTFLNNFNLGNKLYHNAAGNALLYLNSGANDSYTYSSKVIPMNEWSHIAFVFKNSETIKKVYINGVDCSGSGPTRQVPAGIPSTVVIGKNFTGYMSDYREYSTALSADDILTIYKNSGIIDNKWNTHAYEFQENKKNMMWYINNAIIDKTFANGLTSYTQTNCQVTLTDDGYRVYRPPNIVHDSSTMHNMWGGLKININNANHKDHVRETLQTGHKYIILYDVKGQTSKAQTSIGWTNLMGWGGGGLNPAPTNVQYRAIPANFESDEWQTFFYKWDLTDDVYKVCTQSYSSFVQGNTYLSYADFQIGWTYEDTGTLGTDVYIKNIRMYDITDETKPKLMKTGVFNIDGIHESNKTKIRQNEIEANSFIEI